MSLEMAIVIGTTFYKLASLAVGAMSLLLGYRLFKGGIWGNAGDATAKFAKTSLVVKNAAPGTFFAIVGAVIVGFVVYKGISFDLKPAANPQSVTADTPPAVPEPKGTQK